MTKRKYKLKDQGLWEKFCAFEGFEKAFQDSCTIAEAQKHRCFVTVLFRFVASATSMVTFSWKDIIVIEEQPCK